MAKPRPFRFGALAFHVLPRDAWWAYARKVEALGFSSLCMGEHIAFVSGGLVAALTSAADATTSLRLTSHMFMNDMRHPAVLAQEAATIDLLSSGRLELGVGAGWFRGDYEALVCPLTRAQCALRGWQRRSSSSSGCSAMSQQVSLANTTR
jgi:alkanesulfonate monooxygenase SsuD/methylene tetrahydromethanopterin reductase-like flavin-dependent oxidoreductase (luciferase family)